MQVRKRLIALSFIIGLTSIGLVAPAQAAEPHLPLSSQPQAELLTVLPVSIDNPAPVTASKDVNISFASPLISSAPARKAAPVVTVAASEAAQPIQPPAAPTPPAVAPAAPVAVATQPVATTPSAPVAAAAPAPVATAPAVSGVSNSAIAQAALAQIGVAQDCTMLVTNSLAAVGIHFHGWPADYLSLGHVVSEGQAQAGDLIYYADGGEGMAHIAVYIGGGQAVHGGFLGTTKIWSINVGSPPVFIHVDR